MACMQQDLEREIVSQYWNSACRRAGEFSNYKIVDRAVQEVARQGWLFCVVCESKVYSPAKFGCSF